MNLSQIRQIIAINEYGSVSAAARNMGLSQPAISKSIGEWERELGLSLFDRDRGKLKLTAVGRVWLRRAQKIQAEINGGLQETQTLKTEEKALLSVLGAPITLPFLLPKVAARVMREFPSALMRLLDGTNLSHEQMLEMFVEGELDLSIGLMSSGDALAGLTQEPLFEVELQVVARRGHPLTERKHIRWADLVYYKWVRGTGVSVLSQFVEEEFWSHGLELPSFALETDDRLMKLRTLADSDLLCFLTHHRSCGDDLGDELVVLPVPVKFPSWRIGVITHSGTELGETAYTFVRHLRELVDV